MTADNQRIVNTIRGAFVADAACMGTHWIYDPIQMRNAVPSVDAPEFKDPPTPNFYSSREFPGHYERGMLSPYGEQLLFVTEHAAARGKIEHRSMSNAFKEWAETFGGRPDHATLKFLKCAKKGEKDICGAKDDQAHCFAKAVPVTCLYAGKPERRARVEEAIRVHQEDEKAVAFGLALSNILEALLLGHPLDKALETALDGNTSKAVSAAYQQAQTLAKGYTLADTAGSLGRSCHLPESFIIPLQSFFMALAAPSLEGSYEKAVRDNILAAGDTCSRAIAIGAVLGAAHGGPPDDWAAKFDQSQAAKVDAAAAAIADRATGAADQVMRKPMADGKSDPPQRLNQAALDLRTFVAVKNRWYLCKSYKQCFVGSEAVDVLVDKGHAKTREEAVLIGRSMQWDLDLFVHVVHEHTFEDSYLFYRFKE